MKHIVSATALRGGEHLAMCGYVFPSYRDAVDAGHPVGNYMGTARTLSAYHARGVDCESCIVRHAASGARGGIIASFSTDSRTSSLKAHRQVIEHGRPQASPIERQALGAS